MLAPPLKERRRGREGRGMPLVFAVRVPPFTVLWVIHSRIELWRSHCRTMPGSAFMKISYFL